VAACHALVRKLNRLPDGDAKFGREPCWGRLFGCRLDGVEVDAEVDDGGDVDNRGRRDGVTEIGPRRMRLVMRMP
jgi:hypothetical protein